MFTHNHDLTHDQDTLKRSTEIETVIVFKNLSFLVGYAKSSEILREILSIPYDLKDEFSELFTNRTRPTKKELIVKYRLDGLGYQKISTLTGASTATIKKYQDEFLSGQFKPWPKVPNLHHAGALDGLDAVIAQLKAIDLPPRRS